MKKYISTLLIVSFFIITSSYETSAKSGLVDLTQAAEKTVEAVVHVRTKINQRYYRARSPRSLFDFYYGERRYEEKVVPQDYSSGSGVVITKNGYIVTNNHVIDGANIVEVILPNKKRYDAKVIGTDEKTDLALLKIEANNLKYLNYGDSENIKLGEWVLAIGYPYSLSSTVTAGIISAKATKIEDENMKLENFIQTDAAVNPGNSGGALVNQKGELIGINTRIVSPTGSYAGYSFAIPANFVKKIVNDLIEFQKVRRPWMGIGFGKVDRSVAYYYDLPLGKIAISAVYPNSGAYEAGIEPGDIILKIDNKKIEESDQVIKMVKKKKVGDKIKLEIERQGKKKIFTIELKQK
jgi:Do/DeqQ family serine protease